MSDATVEIMFEKGIAFLGPGTSDDADILLVYQSDLRGFVGQWLNTRFGRRVAQLLTIEDEPFFKDLIPSARIEKHHVFVSDEDLVLLHLSAEPD